MATDARGAGFPRAINGAVDMGAYQSVGLAGASAADSYSLSDGKLSDSTNNRVIAGNVTSFQDNQGVLCYLQNDGQLWVDGDADPVATNVANFVIDGAGAVVYLGTNGVLAALTVLKPLDSGTPIVLFKIDGSGSVVVRDQNGNLIRYTPGSEAAFPLDSTDTTTTGGTTVTDSVVTFGVDGTGSVVVLDSTKTTANGNSTTSGTLNLYAARLRRGGDPRHQRR